MFKRNRQRGFTLIELLIVVAIIGIIAAILIPNLLDALQKAKQKRTVADIRDVGTAWMSWLTDQVGAASAGQSKVYVGEPHDELSYTQLFNYLHPNQGFFYMQEVPQLDGWNYEIKYAASLELGACIAEEALVRGPGWANSRARRGLAGRWLAGRPCRSVDQDCAGRAALPALIEQVRMVLRVVISGDRGSSRQR